MTTCLMNGSSASLIGAGWEMRGRKLRREEERSIELKRGRERSLKEAGCFCFPLRFSNQRYLRLLDRRRLSGRYKHNATGLGIVVAILVAGMSILWQKQIMSKVVTEFYLWGLFLLRWAGILDCNCIVGLSSLDQTIAQGFDCELCCLCFFVRPPFLVIAQPHEVRRESVVPSAHHFYLDWLSPVLDDVGKANYAISERPRGDVRPPGDRCWSQDEVGP